MQRGCNADATQMQRRCNAAGQDVGATEIDSFLFHEPLDPTDWNFIVSGSKLTVVSVLDESGLVVLLVDL